MGWSHSDIATQQSIDVRSGDSRAPSPLFKLAICILQLFLTSCFEIIIDSQEVENLEQRGSRVLSSTQYSRMTALGCNAHQYKTGKRPIKFVRVIPFTWEN